jgi:hypothetical protein
LRLESGPNALSGGLSFAALVGVYFRKSGRMGWNRLLPTLIS